MVLLKRATRMPSMRAGTFVARKWVRATLPTSVMAIALNVRWTQK
jgi:hypothetical protein